MRPHWRHAADARTLSHACHAAAATCMHACANRLVEPAWRPRVRMRAGPCGFGATRGRARVRVRSAAWGDRSLPGDRWPLQQLMAPHAAHVHVAAARHSASSHNRELAIGPSAAHLRPPARSSLVHTSYRSESPWPTARRHRVLAHGRRRRGLAARRHRDAVCRDVALHHHPAVGTPATDARRQTTPR